MQAQKPEGASTEVNVESEPDAAPKISLETLLDDATTPQTRAGAAGPDLAPTYTRSAKIIRLAGRNAQVVFRGEPNPVDVIIPSDVDPEFIAEAHARGDHVMVESTRGAESLIVGVLQTKNPRELHLKAESIHIEGEQEVLFKSGRGALRIREDGDIELIGSRISAASRGLFRIVGRLLRLN